MVILSATIATLEATLCRTQNFSRPHPGLTSRVYKENLAMFRTVKEQPIPVEGTVRGNAANLMHMVCMEV